MLKELRRNIFIDWIMLCEFERDVKPIQCLNGSVGLKKVHLHVEAVECHPGRPICLTKFASGGQRFGPIESTNIVKAQKATFKDIKALSVFSVYPPVRENTELWAATEILDYIPCEV